MIGSPPKQAKLIISFDLYFASIIVSIAYGDTFIYIIYIYEMSIYININRDRYINGFLYSILNNYSIDFQDMMIHNST